MDPVIEPVENSAAFKELLKAIIEAKKEFPEIEKRCTGNATATRTYKYADLADIAKAINPGMLKHNLTFIHKLIRPTDVSPGVLLTRLYHIGGAYIYSEFEVPKGLRPQEIGSIVTYGKRYGISALLDLTPDEDLDGEIDKDKGRQKNGNKQNAAPVGVSGNRPNVSPPATKPIDKNDDNRIDALRSNRDVADTLVTKLSNLGAIKFAAGKYTGRNFYDTFEAEQKTNHEWGKGLMACLRDKMKLPDEAVKYLEYVELTGTKL